VIIGVVTRNPHGWATKELRKAIEKLGHVPFIFRFRDIIAEVGFPARVFVKGCDVSSLSAIIVRPIGRCSLEQAIFRMDVLHWIEDRGVYVVNSPSAIEIAVDKYRTLYLLERAGIPVPKTVVGECCEEVLKYINDLGKPIVVKPLFGSRGLGSFRVRSKDYAWRVLSDLAFLKHVLYVQEYIRHRGRDIRVFVIGDRAVAAMYRVARSWKTNVYLGAKPIRLYPIPQEVEELAIKSCRVVGCEIAGVDIVEDRERGYLVLEVNSQPGWRGLQSVTPFSIAEEIVKYVVSRVRR